MRELKLVILGLVWISGWYFYAQLPAYIPSHWNIMGEVDGYMSREQARWLLPLITTMMWGLFQVLPKLDPNKEKYALFLREWEIIQLALIGFMGYMQGIVLYAGIKGSVEINRLMFLGLGGLWVLMGNYLSKIRQNYFIGIKVPWTLSDEENWNQTHRFASWCFVAVGLLMMQNALTLIFPPGLIFVSIMLSAFWPMLYSFLLHEKKLGWMKWISIGVVAIGISLLVLRVLAGEDDWICQNGEWIKHGQPTTTPPSNPCLPKTMNQ